MGDFSHECKNIISDVIAKSHWIIFFLSNDILETMDGTRKYYTEWSNPGWGRKIPRFPVTRFPSVYL